MILLDTSILSTFARVEALDLIWALFPRVPVLKNKEAIFGRPGR